MPQIINLTPLEDREVIFTKHRSTCAEDCQEPYHSFRLSDRLPLSLLPPVAQATRAFQLALNSKNNDEVIARFEEISDLIVRLFRLSYPEIDADRLLAQLTVEDIVVILNHFFSLSGPAGTNANRAEPSGTKTPRRRS